MVRPGENRAITQFRRMGGAIAVGFCAVLVEYSEVQHGSGGGCTLSGPGVTDPLLPGLVLLALAWLGLRRRNNAGK